MALVTHRQSELRKTSGLAMVSPAKDNHMAPTKVLGQVVIESEAWLTIGQLKRKP